MFDIGFWELALVGIVALLVIGPERLPKVARVAGFWLGKARRTVDAVKHEIKEELHAEEMRQMLRDQLHDEELHHLVTDAKQAAKKISEVDEVLTKPAESLLDPQKSSLTDAKDGE